MEGVAAFQAVHSRTDAAIKVGSVKIISSSISLASRLLTPLTERVIVNFLVLNKYSELG